MKKLVNNMYVKYKKQELYLAFLLIVIGILFFFFLGERGYVLQKDSETYIKSHYGTTVMPLYIFYIDCLRFIFGEKMYLDVAVVFQGLLAIITSLFLTYYIKKVFMLKQWQTLIVYVLSFLPYAYSLPEHVSTHEILTEAVAFPIFYVFYVFFYDGILTKRWGRLFIAGIIAVLLFYIRSQLLVLFPILFVGGVLLFIRKRNIRKKAIVINVAAVLLLGTGLFVGLKNNTDLELFRMLDGTQIVDALVGRTIYIADGEDVNLYHTEELQGAFQSLFTFADEDSKRYEYNTYSGRDRWDEIAQSVNFITRSSWEILVQYCNENGWHYTRSEQFQTDLVIPIIFNHMDLFLLTFFELMTPSLMASVFIQKKSIWGFCVICTILLYCIGILLGILNRKEKKVFLFYISTVLILVINVFLVNVFFIGLQRYVVYTFGLYYISLFLMMCNVLRKMGNKNDWENEKCVY